MLMTPMEPNDEYKEFLQECYFDAWKAMTTLKKLPEAAKHLLDVIKKELDKQAERYQGRPDYQKVLEIRDSLKEAIPELQRIESGIFHEEDAELLITLCSDWGLIRNVDMPSVQQLADYLRSEAEKFAQQMEELESERKGEGEEK